MGECKKKKKKVPRIPQLSAYAKSQPYDHAWKSGPDGTATSAARDSDESVSLGLLQWRSSTHLCSLGFSTAIIFCMTTATKILLECRYGPQTAGMPTARWCANMAILLCMMKGIPKVMLELVVFSSRRFQSPRCHLCLDWES